jgi:hypothetical protein
MAVSQELHKTVTMDRYSGASLDSEHCPFTIYMYPSDEYQEIYITNNAAVFSVSVILIFAFVSLVFFIYDMNVERRQKIVLNTAEKTSAIVSSLFPSVIRDQMLHETNDHTTKLKKTANCAFNAKNSPEAAFMSGQSHTTPAMASLYPETTVFFADLAGFTAWSR